MSKRGSRGAVAVAAADARPPLLGRRERDRRPRVNSREGPARKKTASPSRPALAASALRAHLRPQRGAGCACAVRAACHASFTGLVSRSEPRGRAAWLPLQPTRWCVLPRAPCFRLARAGRRLRCACGSTLLAAPRTGARRATTRTRVALEQQRCILVTLSEPPHAGVARIAEAAAVDPRLYVATLEQPTLATLEPAPARAHSPAVAAAAAVDAAAEAALRLQPDAQPAAPPPSSAAAAAADDASLRGDPGGNAARVDDHDDGGDDEAAPGLGFRV